MTDVLTHGVELTDVAQAKVKSLIEAEGREPTADEYAERMADLVERVLAEGAEAAAAAPRTLG